VQILGSILFTNSTKDDLILAKCACTVLQQLGAQKKLKGLSPEPQIRFPSSDDVFNRISSLILRPTESYDWFGLAEQGVNAIYALAEQPDVICGKLIMTIAGRIFERQALLDVSKQFSSMHIDGADEPITTSIGGSSPVLNEGSDDICDAFELSKLCFLIGHVAIKQVWWLEVIETEWKRRKSGSTGKSSKKASVDELEQIPILQVMASLALTKMMCVSSRFCEENLQLLITILEKSSDAIVRSNIVIGLGDIAVSFNSLIDQNISYLYKRLSDTDLTVKKNALMVLTHLVLNGMVKVKGQLSEMAKCLEDTDKRVSDLAKLFFTELATKDNAVYNNLPDIISNLSREETDRCAKKFMEALPLYQDKLHDDLLYKYLQDIVVK
ncbi:Condensin complex subunit, partial [Cladochytrium tenue]